LRVVLDTNIVASGILSATGAARSMLDVARHGQFEVITSPILLAELEEVLERFVEAEAAAEIRVAFGELAEIVEPAHVPEVFSDPDDDQVVSAAVRGGADVIVTRDKDLLTLSRHDAVRILNPADFPAELRRKR
jgi:putative PIN family toxin of toxin-antitoxin system